MASQGRMRTFLTLEVRRSHLVEDTMRQLRQAEFSDLKKPLVVKKIVLLAFFNCGRGHS